MHYTILMYIHLATVLPCVFLGAWLLATKKGSPFHRQWGKIYMLLMLVTAGISLLMPARVGPQWFGHFGWIHSFSLLTLWTIPRAYWAIKAGNIQRHRRAMWLLYVGAIVIAGGFTLSPGRFLHALLFGG